MVGGAVGIENNDDGNFKDLLGTPGNAKALKRNERARNGILIAPSKLPRHPVILEKISPSVFTSLPENGVGFGPKFRGTDGRPTLDLTALQINSSHAESRVPALDAQEPTPTT